MAIFEKEELKYIGIATLFSFVYFIIFLPRILNVAESQSPYIQFFLFSIGIYFLLFFIFKSWAMSNGKSFKTSFLMLIPFMAFDLIHPEYHINLSTGALDKGAVLGAASPDYVLGHLFQGMGISGTILIFCVYVLGFALLLLLASFFRKNFVKDIN